MLRIVVLRGLFSQLHVDANVSQSNKAFRIPGMEATPTSLSLEGSVYGIGLAQRVQVLSDRSTWPVPYSYLPEQNPRVLVTLVLGPFPLSEQSISDSAEAQALLRYVPPGAAADQAVRICSQRVAK